MVHCVRMPEPTKDDGQPGFDVHEHGFDLLKLYSDLVVAEDSNLWVASGLFAAANSVLLVALAVPQITLDRQRMIAAVGFVFAVGWFMAIGATGIGSRRARRKIDTLEKAIGLPHEFSPFRPERKSQIPWWSNYWFVGMLDLVFYFLWAWLMVQP